MRTAMAGSPRRNIGPQGNSSSRGTDPSSSVQQPVADPRFVNDQLRLRRLRLELLPQRADGNTQIFGLAQMRGPPDGAQKVRMRKNPARVLGELGKQVPFLGSHMHFDAIAPDDPR